MHSSVGAYTKGLQAHLMTQDLIVLLITIPILLAISTLALRKQDK
jgi:ribosome-dependent ATPase